MSVSLFYHVQRQNIGAAHNIPEALPLMQRYSYTTTSQGGNACMPTAGHLARKTVGSSIWASDLESVQELKPLASDSWENLAFPDEHNSETPPFPLNVTPVPQTLTDPLLNADSNDWLLSWCESFGHTISLLRCRLRAFYLGPADSLCSRGCGAWQLTTLGVMATGIEASKPCSYKVAASREKYDDRSSQP
jgi:hypothetical protein